MPNFMTSTQLSRLLTGKNSSEPQIAVNISFSHCFRCNSRPINCGFFSRAFATNRPSAFPVKRSTYYDDLGVPVEATKDEVRRAFLKLAKLYHPDTASPENIGNEKFQMIQIAYDVLSDDVKRREYDWRSRGIWRHSPSGIDRT